MLKKLLISLTILLLTACGTQNDITMTTVQGSCPDGTSNAPYCMGITIQNNGGGQNWISSTNFPISNIMVNISGASNLLTPTTSLSQMDPNKCTTSNLNPGANCTFYLQINNESYPVASVESISVMLSYTVNNTLLGTNNSNNASSQTTIYQKTNLYIPQNNGYLWVYNNNGLNNLGFVESYSVPVITSSIDNSIYGYLFLATNTGIYIYTNESTTNSISPTTGGLTGANVMFNTANGLYAISSSSGNVWNYALGQTNESWANLSGMNTAVNTAVYTISPNSNLYLATGSQAWACQNVFTSLTATTCAQEASGATFNLNALGYLSGLSLTNYTGFYAGNNQGLLLESGTSGVTGVWQPVSATSGTINQVNTIVNSNNYSALYAGDGVGQIWQVVPATPNTASMIGQVPNSNPISLMAIDNIGNNLYFIAINGQNSYLYSCGTQGGLPNCSVTLLSPAGIGSGIVGLQIGSVLSTN